MGKYIFKLQFVALIIFFTLAANSQNQTKALPDNSKCLKCHGNYYYKFMNAETSTEVVKKMNPYFIIDKKHYGKSVHRNNECAVCHSAEYENYPHDAKLKLEAKPICQDCHVGDDNFKKYHFDEIDVQIQESVHAKIMGDKFQCELCHNPHFYQLGASKKKDIKEIVKLSNQMCLECHNYDEHRFYLLNDSVASINENSHKWLPNQKLHFESVRCIECHGVYNDTILVTHMIQGKEKAVKKCVECHSSNSLLMTSLYRHETSKQRDKLGFFNSIMMKNSFVIGANRNFYFNVATIGIFSLIALIVIIHIVLRIILKK